MRVNNNNYPYPVLSSYNDDYVESVFRVHFESKSDDINRHYIEVVIELENRGIEKLITQRRAELILHIECPHTSQREIVKIRKLKKKFYINEKKFSGNLELNVFIVASSNLSNYRNSRFNESIFGENYTIKSVEKGTILAATITQTIDIQSDKDQLKNLSSIIKVGITKEYDDMMIDLSSNFILIQLPEQEFAMYNQLSRAKYSDLVLSSVIYPALIYILEMMKVETDYSLDWYKVIAKKIEKLEYSVADIGETIESFQLAQMLLARPLNRALNPEVMEE